jgi:hypothetical protein
VAAVVVIAAAGLVVAAYLEARSVIVQPYTFASSDLPRQFDGLKIVYLSDVHRRAHYFSDEDIKDLVARVNAMRPDLVLLGGDYAYDKGREEAQVFSLLSGLRAKLGVYAVLGNNDYQGSRTKNVPPADSSATRDAIANTGIRLLDNEGVWIYKDGARIRLGDVSDLEMGDPRIAPVISGTTTKDFVLLLSHNPDFSETLPAAAVDLVLSGHTHGGQITFFGWTPFSPSKYGQKYRTGLVRNGKTTTIVSNGLGTKVLPLRLFARPQIVVVTLRCQTR